MDALAGFRISKIGTDFVYELDISKTRPKTTFYFEVKSYNRIATFPFSLVTCGSESIVITPSTIFFQRLEVTSGTVTIPITWFSSTQSETDCPITGFDLRDGTAAENPLVTPSYLSINRQNRVLFLQLTDSINFVKSYLDVMIWSMHESTVTQIGKKRLQLETCFSWLKHLSEGAVLTYDYLLPLNERTYDTLKDE